MTSHLPQSDVSSLVAAVERRFGLRLHSGFHSILAARAFTLVDKFNLDNVRSIVTQLGSADETDPIVVAMKQAATISETFFFRAPKQMVELERLVTQDIAPRLRRRKRRTLRAWSAACSTGEEPYTLAILLQRALPDFRHQIVASDINASALAIARAGTYGRRSFRGVDPNKLPGIKRQSHDSWMVTPELRQKITFVELNLALDDFPHPHSPLGNFDVILCRNVLIYISDQQIPKVMHKLAACAATDAVIVLSSAEYPAGQHLIGFEGRPGGFWTRLPVSKKPAPPRAPPLKDKPPPPKATAPSHPSSTARSSHKDPSASSPLALSAAEMLARAREAADRGDLRGAIGLAEQVVRMYPAMPETHYLMGVASAELHDHARSMREFERALFFDRGYVAASIALGHLLAEQGKDEAALRHLERARTKLAQLAPTDIVPGIELPVSVAMGLIDMALNGGAS